MIEIDPAPERLAPVFRVNDPAAPFLALPELMMTAPLAPLFIVFEAMVMLPESALPDVPEVIDTDPPAR
jgi:hypothetical protein